MGVTGDVLGNVGGFGAQRSLPLRNWNNRLRLDAQSLCRRRNQSCEMTVGAAGRSGVESVSRRRTHAVVLAIAPATGREVGLRLQRGHTEACNPND